MLANTLTLTVNAVDKVLARVNQDNYSSEYRLRSPTESWILKIRNSTESSNGFKYDRHNVEISHIVFATTSTPEEHYTASQTFRMRQTAGDTANLPHLIAGLATLVNANAAAIVQNES